jgi:IS30 family transposase
MRARRQVCRPKRKLLLGSEHFELVSHMLRERLFPEQIAGKLRSMHIPSLRDAYVCRETIYNAIYALPVGELRYLAAPKQYDAQAALWRRGST